jgi:zinc transport system permease protein
MLEALGLPFFQRVLLAGLLASIACGMLGTFVVAKRISSLAAASVSATWRASTRCWAPRSSR